MTNKSINSSCHCTIIIMKYKVAPSIVLRRCYTRQFLLQLVSQFCCDTSCALRYRLLESCYTRQRFSVILEAVVSSAAILSWNKTSRAQKEQFDWPMPLNVATQVAGKVLQPQRVVETIAHEHKIICVQNIDPPKVAHAQMLFSSVLLNRISPPLPHLVYEAEVANR